jgi:hypothetical protein
MSDLLAAIIMHKRMDRAIRRKLSREIRQGRIVVMKDLARWALERYPEALDDAEARRFVDEIARDYAARTRWRP